MEKLPIWRAQKKILNLTNQNIADEANLPLRTVEQIMCGKVKNPRIDTVDAIERVLGLSPDFTQLNEVRKNAGISIEELSIRANLPKSTVEKILFGVVKHPRIDTLQAIERALGLAPTFTEEELAQGVGNHAIVLSDEDSYRLNLLAEAETVLGIEYVRALLTAVEIAIQQKQTK